MSNLVVTGVSSGIGRAVLRHAVAQGAHVFGSVRTQDDATRLQSEFGRDVTPLVFDVRDEQGSQAAAAEVRETIQRATLLGLVNNAGVGLTGPLLHQPLDQFRAVIDTNLLGTLLVTRAFAPLLGTDPSHQGRKGRVVNISSIAGKIGQPFAGAYVASKHAIEGLSDVLRRELNLYGIGVAIVAPATVKTPIWDTPESSIGDYASTDYAEQYDSGVRSFIDSARRHGLDPEAVASAVWSALTARRPRLRYSPAAHPIVEQLLPRVTPDRIVDAVVERAAGLRPARLASSRKRGQR